MSGLLFFVVGAAVVGIVIVIKPVQAHPQGMVKGVITDADLDSNQRYKETHIKYFSPDELTFNLNTAQQLQPEINGAAGLLVDIDTGKVLFEKDSKTKRPIASLVKIMTAVVAIEHKPIDTKIYVSKRAGDIGENNMGINEGEVYTLEELLYGLFMHSGNDAAYAISEGVAGNSNRFVDWMNLKAQELGLNNTHFADPSGLDNSSYSTPEDIAKLTAYALKFEDLERIASTIEIVLGEKPKMHSTVYLYNQTNLLSTYPGVKGFKTGYTSKAGLCLVTNADYGGHRVVGVVLGSNDRKGDMIIMLDHGFEQLGVNIVHNLL